MSLCICGGDITFRYKYSSSITQYLPKNIRMIKKKLTTPNPNQPDSNGNENRVDNVAQSVTKYRNVY